MIEPSIILGILMVGVLYNAMLTIVVIHAVRKWSVLLEQKEQELKRCKMELKAVRSRRI